MKPARVLKALTKSVMAVFTDGVSVATLTSTSPLVGLLRFSVRPSTTLVKVLLAELKAMPLTVSAALAAVMVRAMGDAAALAS